MPWLRIASFVLLLFLLKNPSPQNKKYMVESPEKFIDEIEFDKSRPIPFEMTRQKDEAAILTKDHCGKAMVLAHRALRRGYLMLSVTVAASVVMQAIWPHAPFAVFGCVVGICFFRILVIQEKQALKHEADLENALARARSPEESRSRFFSIVSHDIRTPLNAILGCSEILRHGITNKAERDDALDSIRASGTTLLQLVNDVLDLAKMDAGKLTLSPEAVSLSRLTSDVFASFRLAAAEKGIELVYTKPFTRFEVDPVKMGEKVANFALAVLAKGRIPRPPAITLQYVLGATFPF